MGFKAEPLSAAGCCPRNCSSASDEEQSWYKVINLSLPRSSHKRRYLSFSLEAGPFVLPSCAHHISRTLLRLSTRSLACSLSHPPSSRTLEINFLVINISLYTTKLLRRVNTDAAEPRPWAAKCPR